MSFLKPAPTVAIAAQEQLQPSPAEKEEEPVETTEDTPATADDGVVPLPEARYYRAKELDVIPQPTALIRPAYPETAPSSIRRGIVKLELKLDEDGLVTDVAVVDSEPPGYFEEAAREAFLDARFTPGIKAGQRVRSLLTLKVYFESPRIYNSPE